MNVDNAFKPLKTGDGFVREISVKRPINSTNITLSYIISAETINSIIAIYALILIIVSLTIVTIIFKRVKKALDPSPKSMVNYASVPPSEVTEVGRVNRHINDLHSNVQLYEENRAFADNDSDYDIISLEPARTYAEGVESSSYDTPPEYENPPAYRV